MLMPKVHTRAFARDGINKTLLAGGVADHVRVQARHGSIGVIARAMAMVGHRMIELSRVVAQELHQAAWVAV